MALLRPERRRLVCFMDLILRLARSTLAIPDAELSVKGSRSHMLLPHVVVQSYNRQRIEDTPERANLSV